MAINMKKKKPGKTYVIKSFSLPIELVEWLYMEAEKDGINSLSNYLSIMISREKNKPTQR